MFQVSLAVDGIGHGEKDRLGRDAAHGIAYGQLRATRVSRGYRGDEPEREVLAPSSTAPTSASPTPVRSASASATPVSRVPTTSIRAAAATNKITDSVNGMPLRSGKKNLFGVYGNNHRETIPGKRILYRDLSFRAKDRWEREALAVYFSGERSSRQISTAATRGAPCCGYAGSRPLRGKQRRGRSAADSPHCSPRRDAVGDNHQLLSALGRSTPDNRGDPGDKQPRGVPDPSRYAARSTFTRVNEGRWAVFLPEHVLHGVKSWFRAGDEARSP